MPNHHHHGHHHGHHAHEGHHGHHGQHESDRHKSRNGQLHERHSNDEHHQMHYEHHTFTDYNDDGTDTVSYCRPLSHQEICENQAAAAERRRQDQAAAEARRQREERDKREKLAQEARAREIQLLAHQRFIANCGTESFERLKRDLALLENIRFTTNETQALNPQRIYYFILKQNPQLTAHDRSNLLILVLNHLSYKSYSSCLYTEDFRADLADRVELYDILTVSAAKQDREFLWSLILGSLLKEDFHGMRVIPERLGNKDNFSFLFNFADYAINQQTNADVAVDLYYSLKAALRNSAGVAAPGFVKIQADIMKDTKQRILAILKTELETTSKIECSDKVKAFLDQARSLSLLYHTKSFSIYRMFSTNPSKAAELIDQEYIKLQIQINEKYPQEGSHQLMSLRALNR